MRTYTEQEIQAAANAVSEFMVTNGPGMPHPVELQEILRAAFPIASVQERPLDEVALEFVRTLFPAGPEPRGFVLW